MSPTANARLRVLRNVGALKLTPRVRYEGIEELAKNGLITCSSRPYGIHCTLTDFGRQLAATLPPHSGRGIE